MAYEPSQFRPCRRTAAALARACVGVALVGAAINFAQAATGKPTLLSEATSTRAIALESITLKPEPFALNASVAFSADSRTRIMLFATNLYLFAGEGPNPFTVDAEDAAHRH